MPHVCTMERAKAADLLPFFIFFSFFESQLCDVFLTIKEEDGTRAKGGRGVTGREVCAEMYVFREDFLDGYGEGVCSLGL